MLEMYLAVCADKFYVYDKRSGAVQPFDGNPFFGYDPGKVAPAADNLLEQLTENNNLSSRDELRFFMLESGDPVRNEVVAGRLGNTLAQRYPLKGALERAMSDLGNDKKNHTEFGLNYDGVSYRTEQGTLKAEDFSLLSLTVEPQMLLKYAV